MNLPKGLEDSPFFEKRKKNMDQKRNRKRQEKY